MTDYRSCLTLKYRVGPGGLGVLQRMGYYVLAIERSSSQYSFAPGELVLNLGTRPPGHQIARLRAWNLKSCMWLVAPHVSAPCVSSIQTAEWRPSDLIPLLGQSKIAYTKTKVYVLGILSHLRLRQSPGLPRNRAALRG